MDSAGNRIAEREQYEPEGEQQQSHHIERCEHGRCAKCGEVFAERQESPEGYGECRGLDSSSVLAIEEPLVFDTEIEVFLMFAMLSHVPIDHQDPEDGDNDADAQECIIGHKRLI